MVATIACLAWDRLPSTKLWWAQVTVMPEVSRTVVLRRGITRGLKGSTATGGQVAPSSGTGLRLEWKNAQKKEKKNITSEAINRIIPPRILPTTDGVWHPWLALSRDTSRHHCVVTKISVPRPIAIREKLPVWNHWVRPEVIMRAAIAPAIGHGLRSTMWNGCLKPDMLIYLSSI
jgi:hypothetical protein